MSIRIIQKYYRSFSFFRLREKFVLLLKKDNKTKLLFFSILFYDEFVAKVTLNHCIRDCYNAEYLYLYSGDNIRYLHYTAILDIHFVIFVSS